MDRANNSDSLEADCHTGGNTRKEIPHYEIRLGAKKTFAQALCHPLPPPKYKMLPRKPKIINGELGFVFLDLEIDRAIENLKHALVLKFLSRRSLIDKL